MWAVPRIASGHTIHLDELNDTVIFDHDDVFVNWAEITETVQASCFVASILDPDDDAPGTHRMPSGTQ
jgi:hypothetical protein